MVESFNEVKGESFYSSPPYIYRPSLAQYLSTFSVDKRGFVSEILHLDYINKIHILEMSNEFIRVKLKNKNGLDTSELYVYEYLENNLDFDKNSIVYFSKISKLDVLRFGLFVRGKYLIQFGKSNKSESPKNVSESFFNFFLSFQVMITTFIFAPTFLLSLWFLYIIFLNPVSKIITDHLLMFVFGGLFLAVGWFLVFIFLILGIIKMIQIKDFRVFIIDFLIHYVFFICASFLFTVWSAALLPSSVFEMKIIYSDIIALNFSLMIILFAITSRFFSKFRKHFELSAVLISLGVILFFPNFLGGVFFSQLIYVVVILFLTAKWFNLQLDFISWLTESNLATQHRKKWLAFRKFVKNQSEIDKKDVSHYLLWGPFYYYCLATKGIEHKKISFFRQEKGFIFWSIITVLFVYIVSIVFRILFGYV